MVDLLLMYSSLTSMSIDHTYITGVVAKEQHLAMLANGTLVVKENTKEYWNGVWAALFVQVSSWWIIGIGILYFLMGIFCLKGIRNRFRVQYQARLRAYKDEKKRK